LRAIVVLFAALLSAAGPYAEQAQQATRFDLHLQICCLHGCVDDAKPGVDVGTNKFRHCCGIVADWQPGRVAELRRLDFLLYGEVLGWLLPLLWCLVG
jgi:hypothetical protein